MKYYLSQISERHGDYKHNTIVRFKALKLEHAKQIQINWASHWYPTDDENSAAESYEGEYQYDSGSIAVSCDFCEEISKATYMELGGRVIEL